MRRAAVMGLDGLVAIVGLVATSACGRLEFNSAAVSDMMDGGIDGVPDGPCRTVWIPVRTLDELNSTATDFSPAWGLDGKRIVFESDREGTRDLYIASQSGSADHFSAPMKISELSTLAAEQAPTLSQSGLEIVYEAEGVLKRAIRSTVSSPFAPAAELAFGGFGADFGNNDLDLIYGVNNNGLIRLVVRSRQAATDNDFGVPVVLENFAMQEGGWPSLSRDGLELFYESGPSTPIYTATRPTLTAPFSVPEPIPELGSASDPDISPDGQWLIYVVNVTNEIAIARRGCAPNP
jgi:WD40-like Beta Propeller Repeat